MNRRLQTIVAIITKDLREMVRDKFFVAVTILGVAFNITLFWLLPNTVDETIRLGVYQTGLDPFLSLLGEAEQEALEIVEFESPEALVAALEDGSDELMAGISIPDDFLQSLSNDEPTSVRLFLTTGVPDHIRPVLSSAVRELAFFASGSLLPVSISLDEDIILGVDRAGAQVPMRERFRPMLAFFMLLVETFALAALIASEIQSRTVTAVLVTPVRLSDFLAAKMVLGTGLAFTEVVLLMLAIQSFSHHALLLVCILFLGAVLVTGIGLLAGSSGKDFMGVILWNVLFFIPLVIPAIGALFPGSASLWMKVLPSYGLVTSMVSVTAYDAGFAETLPYLGMLTAWCTVAFIAGTFALKRKVEGL